MIYRAKEIEKSGTLNLIPFLVHDIVSQRDLLSAPARTGAIFHKLLKLRF